VTFQKSTERLPNKIIPTLDKLYDEFRVFGALLNAKIERLQFAAVDPRDPDNHKLQYMNNLRECVRSAADVVSTASTNINADVNDKISVRYGSDFGDVFVRDVNEPMLRWFASNNVYEYEDAEAPLPAPSETGTGNVLTEYHSDTDSDLENDLIRSLFKEGKKRKGQGDWTGAVRHFRNCLTRFSSNANYASLTATQSLTVCGVSKVELLEHLTDSYCLLGSWGKARSTMAEKLLIVEHQMGKKDALYLRDSMKLAELMMKNQDYVEAHLQARRSLRGFKKLGKDGQTDYEDCLAFLIQICQLEGKEDEEEAYAALLVGHARGEQELVPEFQSATLSPSVAQPRLPPNLDMQIGPKIGTGVLEQTEEMPLQPHDSMEESPSNAELHAFSASVSQSLPEKHDETNKKGIEVEENVYVSGTKDFRNARSEDEDDRLYPERDQLVLEQPNKHFKDRTPDSRPHSPKTKPIQANEHQNIASNPEGPDILDTQLSALDMVEDFTRAELVGPLVKYDKPASRDQVPSPGIYPPFTTTCTPTAVGALGLVHEEWCGSPASFIYGTTYPGGVIEFMCTLTKIPREDRSESKKEVMEVTKDFLETYCKMHGQEPRYSTSYGLSGFTCTVMISNTQVSTASGYETDYQAIDAAAAKAIKTYVSVRETNIVMELLGRPDPSSDKEVYIPDLDEECMAATDDTPLGYLPRITFTQDHQSAAAFESPPYSTNFDIATSAERWHPQRRMSHSSMHNEQLTRQGFMGRLLAKSYAVLKGGKTHRRARSGFSGTPPNDIWPEYALTVSSDMGSGNPSSIDNWISGQTEYAAADERNLARPPSLLSDVGEFNSNTYDWVSHPNSHITTDETSFPRPPSIISESGCYNSSIHEWKTYPSSYAINGDEGYHAYPRITNCPIYNVHLSEMTYDAASVHVNSCIDDGSSITNVSQPAQEEYNRDPINPVSRSLRASNIWTPLNGLWACYQCKPDTLQYLSENVCAFCSEPRDVHAPSSLNDFKRSPSDCYQRLPSSPILLTTPTPNTIPQRKVVLLGDTLCGKTYMASMWSEDQIYPKFDTFVMNNFVKTTEIEDRKIELDIWDNNGMEENERLRRLSYKNVHMLLICFDISDPDSFANVEYMVCLTLPIFLRH
jgi:hypothetical protein